MISDRVILVILVSYNTNLKEVSHLFHSLYYYSLLWFLIIIYFYGLVCLIFIRMKNSTVASYEATSVSGLGTERR